MFRGVEHVVEEATPESFQDVEIAKAIIVVFTTASAVINKFEKGDI
jgi:hypothetical protein